MVRNVSVCRLFISLLLDVFLARDPFFEPFLVTFFVRVFYAQTLPSLFLIVSILLAIDDPRVFSFLSP